MGGADLVEHRVVEYLPPGEGDMAGEDHPVALAGSEDLVLSEVGVVLDLIGDQGLRALGHGLVHERHREVREADVPGEAVLFRLRKCAHGLCERHGGLRPVDEEEVDVVEAQGREARLDRPGEVVGPSVLLGHLGGHPEFVAGNP